MNCSYFHCSICSELRYCVDQCVSEHCRGNVARFERAKLKHGTAVRYLLSASPVGMTGNTFMGASLLCELYYRLGREVAAKSAVLKRAVWDDAAYCLDAPELMPAGACQPGWIAEGESFPEQQFITRETLGAL